jgi:glyoxylase-like metal-dependent hydrolase (beta-lactamase superfamily II)
MTTTQSTRVKTFSEISADGALPPEGWELKAIVNEDNMTYLAWNRSAHEALLVDPMREDWEVLIRECRALVGYRFLAVIDTHTHADHVSVAAALAEELKAPLVMHEKAPSRKIHLRVSRDTELSSAAGRFRILLTPGHTQDSLTPIWGPFVFTGDTILYGDTGRDDLPTGDPIAHYESLQKLREAVTGDQIFLTGHDGEGGRATSWVTQLKVNPTLTQDRESFVREAGAYVGPSPKNLRESLVENFK